MRSRFNRRHGRNIDVHPGMKPQMSRRFMRNHFSFPSVSPYYHAEISCFLAQIWVTARIPAAKSELPCPHFSAGERKLKYSGPGLGHNQESAVRIETIYFCFLRDSVPPWCEGLVFGCGYVAPWLG